MNLERRALAGRRCGFTRRQGLARLASAAGAAGAAVALAACGVGPGAGGGTAAPPATGPVSLPDSFYTVAATTKHPDVAWEFCTTWAGLEGQTINSETGVSVPPARAPAVQERCLAKTAVDTILPKVNAFIAEKDGKR